MKLCKHCSGRIIPCRCILHDPPMWKHKANGHHRCSLPGNPVLLTAARAEP